MTQPGEFDGLVEATERLRLPVKVDAFNAVQFGKPDFAAMIVHEEEPGCMAIIAQQLSDQDAEDICTVLNGAATAIQTLQARLAESEAERERMHSLAKANNELARHTENERKRLRAAVNAALDWIDSEDCGRMGPAEDAAHTRLIRKLEAALNPETNHG